MSNGIRKSLGAGTLAACLAAIFLTVLPGASAYGIPCIEVHPDTVSFFINLCAQPPDAGQTHKLTVGNCGDGNLNWFGQTDAQWVLFSPQTGGNFDTVSVSIDWSRIPDIFAAPNPGDTVFVYASIAFQNEAPDTVSDRAVVRLGYICEPDGHTLVAQPSNFDFTAQPGETIYSSVYIYEAHGENISFQYGSNADWLIIADPIHPPVTPDSVSFGIFTEGLAAGTYYDTITVTTDESPSNSPLNVLVILRIPSDTEQYTVEASPMAIEHTLDKDQLEYDSLLVFETGGRNVGFYFSRGESPWLVVEPLGMPPYLTPHSLIVLVNSNGLAPGVYEDTIVVHPVFVSQQFPDIAVPVTLHVNGEMVACGDANGDGSTNVGDAVSIVNYIFKANVSVIDPDSADINCDGSINVGDAVSLINYIFRHGLSPCCQ